MLARRWICFSLPPQKPDVTPAYFDFSSSSSFFFSPRRCAMPFASSDDVRCTMIYHCRQQWALNTSLARRQLRRTECCESVCLGRKRQTGTRKSKGGEYTCRKLHSVPTPVNRWRGSTGDRTNACLLHRRPPLECEERCKKKSTVPLDSPASCSHRVLPQLLPVLTPVLTQFLSSLSSFYLLHFSRHSLSHIFHDRN